MVPARHRISAVTLLAPRRRAGYRGRDHHQGKRCARDRVLVLLRRGVERSVIVDASLPRVDSVPSPKGGTSKEDNENDEDNNVDGRRLRRRSPRSIPRSAKSSVRPHIMQYSNK